LRVSRVRDRMDDHRGSGGPNLIIGGSHGVQQGVSPRRTSSGNISERWMNQIQEETDRQAEDPLYRRPMYYLKEIPPKPRAHATSDAYPVEQHRKELPVEEKGANVKLEPKPPDAKAGEPVEAESLSDWPNRSLPSPLKDNIFQRRDSEPASPSGGSDGPDALKDNIFMRRDSKSKLLENPFLQRDSLSSHSSRSSGAQPAEEPVSPKPVGVIDCPTPLLKENPFLKASALSAPPQAHDRPPVARLTPTLPAAAPRATPSEPAPASQQVLLFQMDESTEGCDGPAKPRSEELAPLLEGTAGSTAAAATTPSKVLSELTPKVTKVNILPEFTFSDEGDAEPPPTAPNGGDTTPLEEQPLNLPPLPLPWPDVKEGQTKGADGSDALASGGGSSNAPTAASERDQDKAPLHPAVQKRPSFSDRLFSRRPSQGK